jgi:hypothetical protein
MFLFFLIHWITFKLIHISHNILKIQLLKKINMKLNTTLKYEKTKQTLHLLWHMLL